jgi:class 3 adenylate cyclase/tetratricopeptide (TPR) repeat protein
MTAASKELGTGAAAASAAAATLFPYVPRLVRSWPDEAERLDVEGTLVSADLSGFTRLSERLASIGREGAEELTTLLNGCFTGMIAEVERFGGDVLKFGGDALLILYRGIAHTERACLSTVAMRDLIAAPLATSTGMRVRLKISQGIHAGTFTCFMLNGNHRELMVTGPGVTETVECEGTAVAGQILLSGDAASNLDRSWLGREIDGRRLLRRIVTVDEPRDMRIADDVENSISDFIPATQREQIAAGAQSEHRRVTVGFVKFSHTDELFGEGRGDQLGSHLQRLAASVAQAERDFGVHWLASDVYPDGGKVILTAGAPVSMGDDEERMLRAAHFVLDEVDGLDLRIGVNAGPVFVGNLGSPTRRTFTVMGDAVNLAARLMQKAESRELVATDATIDRAATRFTIRELEPFLVKGKTAPIRASVVTAVEAKREQIGKLPLIGRDTELRVLLDGAASARAGRGAVVEIVGEPGAGKSRLIEELRRREPAYHLLMVQCGQYARTSPYFAIRNALRTVAGVDPAASSTDAANALGAFVDDTAPELLPLLPLLAIPFDAEIAPTPQVLRIAPQFRRARSHVALGDLLTAAVNEPTIFLVEDLHWVDDATRDLLNGLLTRAQDRPWLFVLTRRLGPDPLAVGADAAHIELQPLDPADALELVISAVGDDSELRPGDWDRLVARAGGNPLFAIELADAARAQGSADALADSVETLVTSKIDTLPARDRLLLREASVLGSVIDVDLLADALDDDEVRDSVRWRALDDFLVRDDERLRFRHAIHQNVAYEGLAYRRRREMHARVARAIRNRPGYDEEAVAGLLSTHYSRAGDHGASWTFSVLAGHEARGKYANVEAAEFYSRSLEAARALTTVPAAEVAEVAEALGDVRDLTTEYEASRRAYALARRHLDEGSSQQAELLRKEGRVLEREGRYTQALRSYSRGLNAIATRDDQPACATRAALLAAYGSARYQQGRVRDAISFARRAIDEGERSGARPALAHALRLIEMCLEEVHDPDRHDYRGLSLPIYEELDDQLGIAAELGNLGNFALTDGRLDEAADLQERSRQAARRAGFIIGEAGALINIAEVYVEQGRSAEAVSLLDRALRITRSSNFAIGTLAALGSLGRGEALLGNGDRALALLDEAISGAEEIHAAWLVAEMRVRRLEALTVLGQNEAAQALAEELSSLGPGDVEQRFLLILARVRVWLLVRSGDNDAATTCVEAAVVDAELAGSAELGYLLRARAELRRRAGDPDAHEDDERADALFERLGVVSTPPLLEE